LTFDTVQLRARKASVKSEAPTKDAVALAKARHATAHSSTTPVAAANSMLGVKKREYVLAPRQIFAFATRQSREERVGAPLPSAQPMEKSIVRFKNNERELVCPFGVATKELGFCPSMSTFMMKGA